MYRFCSNNLVVAILISWVSNKGKVGQHFVILENNVEK